MRVNVINVGSPWRANPNMDFLYTLNIEGRGEPIKTFDAALAQLGEHNAEEYTSKSGKQFWRLVKDSQGSPETPAASREFKADPLKQASIEWQSSLARGVETVRDFYTFNPDKLPKELADYKKDIVNAAITFAMTVEMKPEVKVGEDDRVEDAGDHARINQDDLPPLDSYDE